MSTALLDHVRLSAEQEAVLVRVRGHLAEAIAEAEADGDMPTDAETLERIGELVEAVTTFVMDAQVSDEHFAFGDFGVFAATLFQSDKIAFIEQVPDGRVEAVLREGTTEASTHFPLTTTSALLHALMPHLVR